MYKAKIFNEYRVEDKLAKFLNENKIPREQIISISMSERLRESSVLLVWNDETEEEKAAQECNWEERLKESITKLKALLDKY